MKTLKEYYPTSPAQYPKDYIVLLDLEKKPFNLKHFNRDFGRAEYAVTVWSSDKPSVTWLFSWKIQALDKFDELTKDPFAEREEKFFEAEARYFQRIYGDLYWQD